MNLLELETLYKMALEPVFKTEFRIIHHSDHYANILLDGEKEEFFFTLYGIDCVHLYWCNQCFIFDSFRNGLVSSDTAGEIVFEGKIEIQQLPNRIIELVFELKDSIYVSKKEIVKGKIPSGYDTIKDYIIQAKTNDFLKRKYQLANILIEYINDR